LSVEQAEPSLTSNKRLALKLCQLTCFEQLTVNNIHVIDAGLSQPCFQVDDKNSRYFAKYINDNHVQAEASQLAAIYGISPKIFYTDPHWLITEFKAGEGLDKGKHSEEENLAITLRLLAQCHHVTIASAGYPKEITLDTARTQQAQALRLPALDVIGTVKQLLQTIEISDSQAHVLQQLCELLRQNLIHATEQVTELRPVFCHGDANFSNVLALEKTMVADDEKCYLLIDFECACIAPKEYDVAMLMAVNGISLSKIEIMHRLYLQAFIELNPQKNNLEVVDDLANNMTVLSLNLVTCYYDLSLLINGLWYISQYQYRQQLKYKAMAYKQLMLLEKRYPELHTLLRQMR
jgi:thiamine kinase-like enzyme